MKHEFQQAVQFARNFIQEHPEFTDEVMDLLSLCESEMSDESSSPQHELELFKSSCEELLEPEENEY